MAAITLWYDFETGLQQLSLLASMFFFQHPQLQEPANRLQVPGECLQHPTILLQDKSQQISALIH